MHRRLSWRFASLMFIGWLGTGCGEGALAEPTRENSEVSTGVQVKGLTTSATWQGCTFTVAAVARAGMLPPYYDYVVTRQSSLTCPYGSASTTVASSYTSDVAITGNSLGIAVAFTTKNTPSGSSPISVGIRQIAPDTLGTVRSSGLSCGPSYYSVYLSNLFIPDGTTLQVDGTKGCVIYGGGETGSGSNYHAYYSDFFTTTNPPTIVAY